MRHVVSCQTCIYITLCDNLSHFCTPSSVIFHSNISIFFHIIIATSDNPIFYAMLPGSLKHLWPTMFFLLICFSSNQIIVNEVKLSFLFD